MRLLGIFKGNILRFSVLSLGILAIIVSVIWISISVSHESLTDRRISLATQLTQSQLVTQPPSPTSPVIPPGVSL